SFITKKPLAASCLIQLQLKLNLKICRFIGSVRQHFFKTAGQSVKKRPIGVSKQVQNLQKTSRYHVDD
ncbi:MAG: hypothetical protein ACXV8I_04480, partial [Methylobacter sp.]